jgi:hypothetical protein
LDVDAAQVSQELPGQLPAGRPGRAAWPGHWRGEQRPYVSAAAVTTSDSMSSVEVVGADNKEQAAPVTLGVRGSTVDQILTGLTVGEKVLTLTATASTGTTRGGAVFRGGGGLGGASVAATGQPVADDERRS